MGACLIQQISFDLCLLNAIFTEWIKRLIFRGWHYRAMTIKPHGATMQVMLDMTLQRFHYLASTILSETDQIYHNVWLQVQNALSKCVSLLFRLAVGLNLCDTCPGSVG